MAAASVMDRRRAHERRKSAEAAEIGPLPAVVHPVRRRACGESLHLFLTSYFPESTGSGLFSPEHVQVIDRIEEGLRHGGRFVNAVFRGNDVISGDISEAAGLQELMAIGLSEERAQALLDDVADGSIDDPEVNASDPDPPLEVAEPGLAAAWLHANCGTGDGGFQPGNECGKGGGGGSASGSAGPRKVRMQSTPEAKQQMQTLGLTSQQVAGLAGEFDGAEVAITKSSRGLEVRSTHADYTSHRTISRDAQGELTIVNQRFDAARPGEGTGTRNLLSQVDQAEKLGVTKISCLAERSGDENGYYSWARMGFDAPIPAHLSHQFPASAKRISDLMRTKQGRALWKEHGEGIRMEFDMRDGSTSRRTLTKYARARKIEPSSSDLEVSE
ncbi:MAG: hypothetical protein ACK5Q5_22485 [Planctomycetaceae bacterium]